MVGPLEGIKVLDLSQGVSGPYCTQMLADLGAEVIKIEPPIGDIARGWGPPFVTPDRSAYFFSLNRNKKSVVLDLKAPLGREALLSLIRWCDVLLENFRPGVLERLNFSWDSMRKINPNLVYCSLTGYGQDGPSANETAFDIIIQARSGLMYVTGESNGLPAKMGVPIVDIGSGMYAAFAIMSAIYKRSQGHGGSRIDVSMLDSAFSWLCYWVTGYSATGSQLPIQGNVHPTIAPYQLFRTNDGVISLAVTSERLWQRFVEALGINELATDARFQHNSDRVSHREELTLILNDVISGYKSDEFVNLMTTGGIPCASVQDVSHAMSDAQLVHRKMILQLENIVVPGSPVKFDSPSDLHSNPPKLGEDTMSIISEILGWDDEKIIRLRKEVDNSSA